MPAPKYDFNQLKLDYFTSEIDELTKFLEQRVGDKWTNGNITRATAGWREEKENYKRSIIEKALEDKKNEMAEKLDIPVEHLLEAKKAVVTLLRKKIKYYANNDERRIDVNDLDRIYRITKTELGEPTVVSKNENENRNVEVRVVSYKDDDLDNK